MARVEREYETIIKGLNTAEEELNNLFSNAKKLDMEASTAESELKDRVGQKDIKAIKDLAEAIRNAVNPGIERIRELTEKMEEQNKRFDELEL